MKLKRHAFLASALTASLLVCTPKTASADQLTRIMQLAGENALATSLKINLYANATPEKVFVATKKSFADALSGGVLAGEQGGALLFAEDALDAETQALADSAKEVVILGGENAVSMDVEASIKTPVRRIYGLSRFDTTVAIAKELGTERNLVVVNARNFADALSATPLSLYEDRNILLTDQDVLPTATKEYLLNYGKGKDILFIGGELSISQQVKEEIYDAADLDPSLIAEHTLAGASRYDTSLAVARRFGSETSLIVADGENFTDALSASTLAAAKNSPVLLLREDHASLLTEYLKEKPVNDLTILGGSEAIHPTTVQKAVAAAKGVTDPSSLSVIDEEGQLVHLSAPIEEQTPESESTPEENEAKEPPAKETVSARTSFIEAALTMEGFRYSQARRMSEGYADCSSLVLRAMQKSGVQSSKKNLTSSSISSDSRFYSISKSELEPGDILWRSGHLAIYMGAGKTFEARGSKSRVGYFSMGNRFSRYYRIKGI